MHRALLFTALCLVLAIPAMISTRAHPAPPKFDLDNITAYRLALGSSTDPESAVIRQEITNGPRDLAEARAAALKDGISLTVKVKPLPPDENAVPLYMQWSALRDKLPYPMYADPMTLRNQYTSAQVAEVQKLVDDNKAADILLMEAIKIPSISDQGNDSLGNVQPLSQMREAARQIRTEATLLALKGQWADAARMQANGFAIQKQLQLQPNLVGYLTAQAIEAIAIAGLQDILASSTPNEETTEIVSAAVSHTQDALALKEALRGEPSFSISSFEDQKKIKFGRATDMLNDTFSAQDGTFYIGLVDAGEARWLNALRVAFEVSDGPSMQRRADMEQRTNAVNFPYSDIKNEPVAELEGWLDYRNLDKQDDERTAREQITLAAAAVLSDKVRTGAFPAVLPGKFLDPFSGGPLVYKAQGAGFIIYSVGPTGRYDGQLKKGSVPHWENVFRYPASPPARVPSSLDNDK